MAVIESIQLKRGKQATLIAKLKPIIDGGIGVLLAGEPAYETDTHGIKIGDGIHSFEELPYLLGSGSGGEDDRFVITPPEGDLDQQEEILIYDKDTGKWINKALVDGRSIIYLDDETKGLSIKGYDTARQGQMLVKDAVVGLDWVTPLSDSTLQARVNEATTSANDAAAYATTAASSAIESELSAKKSESMLNATMNFVNNKFWWGTEEEYNALEDISDDVFYFIKIVND